MEGSRVALDVAYVEEGDFKQKLDVYAPKDGKGLPVIVFVHGGEWGRGDKSEVSCKPRFLNENGVVLVSLNYRLSYTAMWPAQAEDVALGLKWVRDHIEGYGGDPKKIVLMGHSAGCHIVSMVGLTREPLGAVGMSPTDLAGVVAWSGGAYDLPVKVAEGGMYAPYIRKNFGEGLAGQQMASPIHHVGDTDKPPFLYATTDQANPGSIELTKTMVEKINGAGGKASYYMMENRSHKEALTLIGTEGDETGKVLLKFVREVTAGR